MGTGELQSDLVIVANRLPVRRADRDSDAAVGSPGWILSPGGLVAGLAPVMDDWASDGHRAAWVGWSGGNEAQEAFEYEGIRLVPLSLSDDEKELYYDGMSNGTIWPLYHDKIEPPQFHRTWFDGYRRVNQRFAEAAAEEAAQGATVWVQDYQLQLVPRMLRMLRPDLRIGFFLHIPFPPPELYYQIPWRRTMTEGLLGADLVGFQTPTDAANFSRLTTTLELADHTDSERGTVVTNQGRVVGIKAFPIGIDVDRYTHAAHDPAIAGEARNLRARLGQPHTVLLGVDRLDYTKGIDVRLRAYKELLAEGRLNPDTVTMVQVAEPSRDDVEAYVSLRERVERLVGEINGDFGRVGFPLVHYIHQSRRFDELLALYAAADVMVVTPFRDGMNLVAKEYVAARSEPGVLVLSEFAGAANELTDALTVNPYDIDGVKLAIETAVNMPRSERQERMERMRQTVIRSDASTWGRRFIEELANHD